MVKHYLDENMELPCELRVQVSSFWVHQRITLKKLIAI